MTTYVAPGAHVIPVANTAGDLMPEVIGLSLHVQSGNGSPAGWFNNPEAQASSTWWVAKTGRLEQYTPDCRTRMWAQGAGNATYCSVETEGLPDEPLTQAQVETLAALYAWGHTTFGWPFQNADKPGQPGFGWHGMGCAPNYAGPDQWGDHPNCPGDIRRGQRAPILALAKHSITPPTTTTTKGNDMLILTIDDGPGGSYLAGAGKTVHIPNGDVAPLKAAGLPEVKVSGALIHELTN